MPSEIKKEIELKIAHVLFIDIVAYSKMTTDDQRVAIEKLNQIVQSTDEFRRAESQNRLLKIATGDGMALIFYDSPEEPVECALEISRVVKERHPDLRLRMGAHSGPVSGVVDVTGRANVAGAGINKAQRVMDCGDAGHILLSSRVAEDLEQFKHWRPHLYRLGECEVKHGEKIEIVNLFTAELGNPQRPKRLMASAHVINVSPTAQKRVPSRNRTLIISAWIAIAAAVIGVGWWWTTLPGRTPTSPHAASRIASLAVLPFKNYSGDPNQEYFADGMTDLLTTELSGIGALTVKSHQSALKFKDSTKSMPEIGQELNADAVVEGSVLRDGNQVTMNVQLIDARTDRHLWAKKFEGEVTNIFKMRNEVVEAVAHQIQATISPEQSSRLSSAQAVNPAALQEYLLGRQAWNRQSEKGFDDALNHFSRAKEIDPNFALAWAGLADTYWGAADANIPPVEAATKAKAAARRALELDDSLAEAHSALGAVNYVSEFQWAESEKEFQRAIQLKPNYAPAHWQYGWLLIMLGRLDEAQREMQRAVESDPLSAVMTTDLNVPYALKKDYDKAVAQCHKAMELDPSFYLPHFVLGWIEIDRGTDYAKAIEEFRVAQAMETQPIIIAYLGFAYARNGQQDKAMEMLNELDQLAGHRFVTPFCQALVYFGLRDNSKAMDWLEKAYDERSVWVGWLKVEPMYDPLRSDPRFQALYKKMNFPP